MRLSPRLWLAIAGLVPLVAGCNDAPGDFEADNASVADIAARVQTAQTQQPGQWETTRQILSVERPDMAPDSPVAALMDEQLDKTQTRTACVTADRPQTPIFAGAVDPGGTCRYDHIAVKGGHIDAQLTCPAADGPGSVAVRQRGDFTPTRFTVETRIADRDESGAMTGAMTTRVTARRNGPCKT